ncbi:MAG: hypothetical protein HZA35_03365 [Parcubacteria group bacterium]|nr:hypothetical protein [Parcubacteria group bacterium]
MTNIVSPKHLLFILVVSFMFTVMTINPIQAAPRQYDHHDYFTSTQVKVMLKLVEKIMKSPHRYVHVQKEGEVGYRITFDQSSSAYRFSPYWAIAFREEPRENNQMKPTRLYGSADFNELIGTIAGEAGEPIPTLTREEESDSDD